MEKKKLIALIAAVVFTVAGAYFGLDLKGAVCGADVEAIAE